MSTEQQQQQHTQTTTRTTRIFKWICGPSPSSCQWRLASALSVPMPSHSPRHSPSPTSTSTSTYAKSPPLTIVRLKLPPSQSEQGSSNGTKWPFSIIQMENLHKQTSAKTNGNKPWKIKKPKRKFTRARHCRCAVCRCRLPFPALLHCFISQKFRTNRGALKANEPQVCPSLSAASHYLPCSQKEDNAIAKPMKCFNFLPQTSHFD